MESSCAAGLVPSVASRPANGVQKLSLGGMLASRPGARTLPAWAAPQPSATVHPAAPCLLCADHAPDRVPPALRAGIDSLRTRQTMTSSGTHWSSPRSSGCACLLGAHPSTWPLAVCSCCACERILRGHTWQLTELRLKKVSIIIAWFVRRSTQPQPCSLSLRI